MGIAIQTSRLLHEPSAGANVPYGWAKAGSSIAPVAPKTAVDRLPLSWLSLANEEPFLDGGKVGGMQNKVEGGQNERSSRSNSNSQTNY